jgi:hypothetical protein
VAGFEPGAVAPREESAPRRERERDAGREHGRSSTRAPLRESQRDPMSVPASALMAGKSGEGLKTIKPAGSSRRSRKAQRESPALLLPPRYKVEVSR